MFLAVKINLAVFTRVEVVVALMISGGRRVLLEAGAYAGIASGRYFLHFTRLFCGTQNGAYCVDAFGRW